MAVLTGNAGTVNRGDVGRPSLGVKETKVRLTEDTRARIAALGGPNRMAVFIREAVEAELQRREAAAGARRKPGKGKVG